MSKVIKSLKQIGWFELFEILRDESRRIETNRDESRRIETNRDESDIIKRDQKVSVRERTKCKWASQSESLAEKL